MSEYVTAGRVGLHGQEALAWLEQRGWQLAGTARNVMLIADELHLPTVTLRRIAHPPMTIERLPGAEAGGILMLLHEGTVDAVTETMASGTIGVGATLRFSTTTALTTTAAAPVTWLQVESLSLRDHGALRGDDGTATAATFDLLSALAASVLGSGVGYRTDAAVFIDQAMEACALAHARSMDAAPSSGATTYARARAHLARWGHAPDFSVSRWAAELGLSREHLARLVRAHGDSPSSLLVRQRLAVAGRLRAQHPDMDDVAIAAASGFRSARALREATQRAGFSRRETTSRPSGKSGPSDAGQSS